MGAKRGGITGTRSMVKCNQGILCEKNSITNKRKNNKIPKFIYKLHRIVQQSVLLYEDK